MHIVLSIALMAVSCLIIWRSAAGFEIASDYLGRNLSHGIKGATINAIASSMPEFLSSFFFLFYLKDVNGFSGGLGITAGSSIFNLLVIPSAVVFVLWFKRPGQEIRLTLKVLRRDGLVLILTILILVLVIARPSLGMIHGFILFSAYLVYLVYMFISMKRHNKGEKAAPQEQFTPEEGLLKNVLLIRLENIIVGHRTLRRGNAWMLLIASTVVMSLGTWLLVLGTEWLSDDLGIPIIFIAVVLSAAASSVPDTVISIKDAKKGNYDDAISNALGSNIFDISFALGLPLFLYTLVNGPIQMDNGVIELSTELWMFLLITTVIAAIVFNASKKLSIYKAWLFTLIYALFVAYVIGHAMGMPLTERISDFLFSTVEHILSVFS